LTPYWAALGVAILISLAGQTLLKSGAGAADFIAQLLDWHTVLGLVASAAALMVAKLAATMDRSTIIPPSLGSVAVHHPDPGTHRRPALVSNG
jgi:hypothetical protein